MNRRRFISTTACGAGGLAMSRLGSGQSDERPNILFITVDDMNCDSVGAFGCSIPGITPNMDRLAQEGIRFEHSHLNIAVCQPCRESITTGRYPHNSGGEGFEPIHEDVPTLPELLGGQGYLNGIFAKSGHYAPLHRYFWDVRVLPKNLGGGRDPSKFYAYAQDFFGRAKSEGRPFFLHANSVDPHRPFPGSAQLAGKPKNARAIYPDVRRAITPDEVIIPPFLPDLPDVRKEIAEYFTSVHRADETVGELLRALNESGQANNTIVLLISDNGMAFPFAKTNVYNASTRTPLMVRWPGHITPETVDSEHMLSCVDIMPTLLDASGVAHPEGLDGRSFLTVLKGGEQEGRESIFSVFHETSAKRRFEMRCLRTRDHSYIYNAWSDGENEFRNESQSGLTMKAMRRAAETDDAIAARVHHFIYRTPEELYDLQGDPDELVNRIGDEAESARIAAMRAGLDQVMQQSGDPLLETFRQYVSA